MEPDMGRSANGLKPEALKTVREKANAIFRQLKEKYRDLSGYLVFSSNWGQCELTTDMIKILKDFPEMVAESWEKEKALELIKVATELETSKKSGDAKAAATQAAERAKADFSATVNQLILLADVYVEIRFKRTDLDLIFALQEDELISRKHTPQTKASIRIVLGTLGQLR